MTSLKNEYRKVRHQIYAGHSPIEATIRYFCQTSMATLRKVIPFLSTEPFFNVALSGKKYPKRISELGKSGNMPMQDDVEHALYWIQWVFRKNQKDIRFFIDFQNQYDSALLLGNYTECFNILDKIHEKFGYSMWEIERRIMLLGESNNSNEQDSYIHEILCNLKAGSVERYRVICFSRQCKRNVTVDSFLNMLDSDYQYFNDSGLPVAFCKYIRHTLTKSMFINGKSSATLDQEAVCYALYFDDKNSLIDRYLGFKSLSATILYQHDEHLKQQFFSVINDLYSIIPDIMFENFISLYQNGFAKFHSLGNNEICKAVDAYTIGHYEKCLNLTRRLLQKNAVYFPLIDLYAKACIYINENRVIEDKNCLLNDILYKLWQLHSQRDDIQEVQKSLIKLAYTHIDDPWSRELLLITEKYAHNLCSLVVPMSSALYSSISLPSVLFSFDEQYATAYCEGASELFRNCLSVQFALGQHRTKK